MKKQLIIALAAAAALPVMAQEKLEETLHVEGEYVPTVIRRDKIHLLPQKVSFELPAVSPVVATDLLVGDYLPEYSVLDPLLWQGRLKPYDYRGYVMAGLGSYLNSTLSAGYRFGSTDTVKGRKLAANVWLQHASTSLFHPRLEPTLRDAARYRYDETIGADLTRSTNSDFLSASLAYHIGNFNYYGLARTYPLTDSKAHPKFPTQTLNDISLKGKWIRLLDEDNILNLRLNAGYFAYRCLYLPENAAILPLHGQREFQVAAGASIFHKINSGNALSLDLDFTNLSYNKVSDAARSRSLQALRLTPAYRLNTDRFSLSAGVVADVTWGAGKSFSAPLADRHYSTLHVAPDVRLSYDATAWNLLLSATGGQRLHTLRDAWQLDYYQMPLLEYLMPEFIPIELKARLGITPSERFKVAIDFTYTRLRHLFLGGMYMYDLSLPAFNFPPSAGTNLSGYSIGLDLHWQPIDAFTLSGRGTYQPQSLTGSGYFNGYDRPRWTLDAAVNIRPIADLSLEAAYKYRGVRNVWYRNTTPDNVLTTMRLPDLCSLSFGARYSLSRALTIFGSANNLLGRRVTLLPNQPDEGFNFLLGVDFLF